MHNHGTALPAGRKAGPVTRRLRVAKPSLYVVYRVAHR
jgi:hypothetical protein